MRQQPRHGEVEEAPVLAFGKLNQLFDRREILVGEKAAPFTETRSLRQGVAAPILTREQSTGERIIRNERESETLTFSQHLRLGIAVDEAILILYARETRVASWRHALG